MVKETTATAAGSLPAPAGRVAGTAVSIINGFSYLRTSIYRHPSHPADEQAVWHRLTLPISGFILKCGVPVKPPISLSPQEFADPI